MNKTFIYDASFLVIATLFLTAVNHYDLLEQYFGYALIPFMAAYLIGKYVGGKSKNKPSDNSLMK